MSFEELLYMIVKAAEEAIKRQSSFLAEVACEVIQLEGLGSPLFLRHLRC